MLPDAAYFVGTMLAYYVVGRVFFTSLAGILIAFGG